MTRDRKAPKGVLIIRDEPPRYEIRCPNCCFLMTAQSEAAIRAAAFDHAEYARWVQLQVLTDLQAPETRSYAGAPR